MDLKLFEIRPRIKRLLGIEKTTLIYAALTTVLLLVFWQDFAAPVELLLSRLFVVAGMGLTILLYRCYPSHATRFLRNLYPLTLLAFWYPDTYEFCQLLPNLDHVFASADLALFGCQPALEFAALLPQKLWSELFHLGYFSYYPMIFLTILAPLFTDRRLFEPTAFVVMTAFLLYYIVYLFLPVAGPQYYFHAVGTDIISCHYYPEVGDYFRTHTEMRPSPGPDGFFRSLIETTQANGERPTAAFPSSHVGMSTILMILLWRNRHFLAWCMLPFYLLLCGATVYIEAHYLIDVFGGWVSALVLFKLCQWLYTLPFFGGPQALRI
ncbi:MAG: phosphatase PAP2 family protein [Bacteroidaceae bacterium]|nr:phosphatase PAP2 family protein [Bacteroidaceae bacterium]